MKVTKNYNLISNTELEELEKDFFRKGWKKGEENQKERVEELEKALTRKDKALGKLQTKYDDYIEFAEDKFSNLETKIEVLEEKRDSVREVVKQTIENEDTAAVLEAKEEALNAREERLNDRESDLNDAEGRVQKGSYADGLADGLRKAHEITQEDRNNAMKIAMVSASSHTPVETMKELNNAHQLTTGSKDQ